MGSPPLKRMFTFSRCQIRGGDAPAQIFCKCVNDRRKMSPRVHWKNQYGLSEGSKSGWIIYLSTTSLQELWYLGISAPTIARVPSSSPVCLQGKLLDLAKSSSSSRIGGSGLSLPSFSSIPSNCSALSLIFRDFFFTEWPEEWMSFFSGWWAWAKSGALWPEVSLSVSWIEVRLVVSSRASRSCLSQWERRRLQSKFCFDWHNPQQDLAD